MGTGEIPLGEIRSDTRLARERNRGLEFVVWFSAIACPWAYGKVTMTKEPIIVLDADGENLQRERADEVVPTAYELDDGPLTHEQIAALKLDVAEHTPRGKVISRTSLFDPLTKP